MDIDLQPVLALAREAGARILEIYGGPVVAELKEDRSPLTAADRASHEAIEGGLRRLFPGVPVLSEEGKEIAYDTRRSWERFWLVDPLDGTKEFLKRNGEFTVNIALIEEGTAAAGVIFAPALNKLYWGVRSCGSWRQEGTGAAEPLRTRKPDPERGLTVVRSRSHPSAELDEYLKTLRLADAVSVGSSLKLCAVAEGRADLYPRFGPTMEWDTAAGQAILEEAGGQVVDLQGKPLAYNKPDLRNPFFLAKG